MHYGLLNHLLESGFENGSIRQVPLINLMQQGEDDLDVSPPTKAPPASDPFASVCSCLAEAGC